MSHYPPLWLGTTHHCRHSGGALRRALLLLCILAATACWPGLTFPGALAARKQRPSGRSPRPGRPNSKAPASPSGRDAPSPLPLPPAGGGTLQAGHETSVKCHISDADLAAMPEGLRGGDLRDYSYKLWLPSSYQPGRQYNMIVIGSPSGNAAMGGMASWIKANDYVAVMLGFSMTGYVPDIAGALVCAYKDVLSRLPNVRSGTGQARNVCAGFSAGARACTLGGALLPFDGLLLQGATTLMGPEAGSLMFDPSWPACRAVATAITIGNTDSNRAEVDDFEAQWRNAAGANLKVFRYTGGHVWAPEAVVQQALDFLRQRMDAAAGGDAACRAAGPKDEYGRLLWVPPPPPLAPRPPRPPVLPAPSGSAPLVTMYVTGHLSTLYEAMLGPKSWADAEADCATRGGHLMSIVDGNDEYMAITLSDKMFEYLPVSEEDMVMWVGLRCRAPDPATGLCASRQSYPTWSDGADVVAGNGNVGRWGGGELDEPPNASRYRLPQYACAAVPYDGPYDRRMKDLPCETLLPYVCKRKVA